MLLIELWGLVIVSSLAKFEVFISGVQRVNLDDGIDRLFNFDPFPELKHFVVISQTLIMQTGILYSTIKILTLWV